MINTTRGFEPEFLDKLRKSYQSEKEFNHLKFLNDLVEYREAWYIGKIVGADILFYRKYTEKVVRTVLEDLGYKLTDYDDNDKKHTVIRFVEAKVGN